jgi:hypothetical protein
MENQITCPHCKRTISNNPVIESAVKGENLGSTFLICECGEKITYWAITAQLRDQKSWDGDSKIGFINLPQLEDKASLL